MTTKRYDIVPGMAETISERMTELGLSPGELERRSGLTDTGLAPIRRGERRNYQARLKFGLAKALEWRNDAVDRMLAGLPPIPLEDETADVQIRRNDGPFSSKPYESSAKNRLELLALTRHLQPAHADRHSAICYHVHLVSPAVLRRGAGQPPRRRQRNRGRCGTEAWPPPVASWQFPARCTDGTVSVQPHARVAVLRLGDNRSPDLTTRRRRFPARAPRP